MPKQRDIATLREAVLSSSFTPAVRDIGTLTELLGDPDEAVVHGAETAIVRAGSAVLPRLLEKLGGVSPEARARAFRVVGRFAPVDAGSARLVIAGLLDGDARVQRGAAHALGRLQGSEVRGEIAAALLHAWDEAPELPLARALAEAMGKLGVVEGRPRLESVLDGDAELARVARKAVAMLERDGARGEPSEIDDERAGDFDVNVVLLCRAGLESIVEDEIRERCASARSVGLGEPGQVVSTWRGSLRELMTVRTMLSVAFALPREPCAGEADVEAACVRALTSPAATRILETWTKGVVRYRLEWEGKGHGRGATWRIVHALAERRPGWVNDPTRSTWQASVKVVAGEVRVLLSPKTLRDPRFLYRVKDVPAASHPTIAAALVRASRPRPDDVVWDPFVGSGSELIERARAGPYRSLIGSDLDPEALSVARTNAAAAAVGIALEQGDAREHAPAGVTSIITNPPMGRRVARDGSLADLLDAFVDHAARVLMRGGRLTWLSPLGGRTAARAEANGLAVTLRQSVDMGGFRAELQVWEKA